MIILFSSQMRWLPETNAQAVILDCALYLLAVGDMDGAKEVFKVGVIFFQKQVLLLW